MRVPSPGIIIDRYQVENFVGAGSMGDVVQAVDIDLKRKVAIKILSDKHRDNPELEARFIREGRAVAAISHANVVQVFTTGTFDGRPYIAMEFLVGTDLGTFVASRGPMSSLHAARALLDSARGLQAATTAGLIHRDVKPSNLIMLDTGVVKVTDFGLAKPVDPKSEPALTAMGVVVGTPDYIAPEQARGEAISEKVDIYALGGTLFYLLVGKPPFRTGDPNEDKYLKVVARHLKDPAPNPMLVNPSVDGELARLQLRMMSKKPEARPGYEDLITELMDIVDRLGGRRAKSAPEVMPPQGSGPTPGPSAPTPFLGKRAPTPDLTDSAETHVHVSRQQPAAAPRKTDSSFAMPQVQRSRPLIVLTMLSSLIFVVGLGLFLFGPLPDAEGEAVVVAADAAPVAALAVPDAAPVIPDPPEGMIVVPATADHPTVFMSVDLVSYGIFLISSPIRKNRPATAAAANNLLPR